MVVLGTYEYSAALAVVAASVVLLTSGYILWTLQRVFFGTQYKGPHGEGIYPMTPRELAIAAPILALAILFGVYPQAVLRYTDKSLGETVQDLTAWEARQPKETPAERTAAGPALGTNEVALD
jgi:NADH-quinone oxidoreductase subunit M